MRKFVAVVALMGLLAGTVHAAIVWDVQGDVWVATLLTNTSIDETASDAISPAVMAVIKESAIYIDWPASTASGAVQIETAHSDSYEGTWAPLGDPITFAGSAPKQDVVQITGMHRAIRVRVSTVVVGGTGINVYFTGN